jgi:CheY-like chemotaxis protein
MANERPILLVEDNPDDEALTLHAFAKNQISHPIVVAHDGVEAVEFLFGNKETSALPVLVLLDLKLPRIDGLEVLRRIRADERTALLPVVILTTSRESLDLRQAYHLGANSYIRKPVDFDRFQHAVGLLGNYWLNLNETVDSASRGAY